MSHVDRLAAVSRILFDERVIEMRQEVERLKLEVFWRDNCLFRLQKAMATANGNHMQCMCTGCALSGRTIDFRVDPHADRNICKFSPWFDAQLLVLGFVVSDVEHPNRTHIKPYNGVGPLKRNDCFDSDCHFIKLGPNDLSWYMFAFGERLWKAKNVNDPELQKLSNLISVLEGYDDED